MCPSLMHLIGTQQKWRLHQLPSPQLGFLCVGTAIYWQESKQTQVCFDNLYEDFTYK